MHLRYLRFSGDDYYPSGGIGDYDGSFDTVEEAMDLPDKRTPEWAHIVDTERDMRMICTWHWGDGPWKVVE